MNRRADGIVRSPGKSIPLPRNRQRKAASLPGTSAEGGVSHTEVQKPASPALPAEPETFDSLIVKGDLAFQAGNYQNALSAYSATQFVYIAKSIVKAPPAARHGESSLLIAGPRLS